MGYFWHVAWSQVEVNLQRVEAAGNPELGLGLELE